VSDPPYPRELIRASAGTGKTHQISNRIVGLLAEGVEPGRILASTFTRKAAGEILDRVLHRLARAALDPAEADTLSDQALLGGAPDGGLGTRGALRLLDGLVRRLHRIDVGTLDALLVRIARNFSLEIGLPPRWTVADEPRRERLRSEAVQTVLEDGDPTAIVELLRMSARGRADRRVHDRLVDDVDSLHRHHLELDPDADDPWSPFRERSTPDDVEATCRRLAGRLAGIEPPLNADGTPNSPWSSALDDAAAALRDRDWRGLWRKGPPSKLLAGERTYYGKPFPDGLEAVLEEARTLAAADLAAAYGRQAEALGRIARRYHGALRAEQRRAGAYGFRDVADLLGGPRPVAGRDDLHHRLDRRSEHVLLDEFQDTSTPQWRAIRPVVDRVASDPGRGRSLVVVADPKQSIYGWRGADPEIVERVGRLYGLDRGSLRRSWRSGPQVLGFVNRLFGAVEENPIVRELDGGADVAGRWAEAFEEHAPAPPLRDSPGRVTVEAGPEDEGRGTDRPRLAARAADRVAGLHRDAPGAEIGVLVRRNKTVARLIHELRARGVEASEEGGTSVDDAAPVAAVLALLRLADHPGDRIARYHVASTPLGPEVGLTDHRDDERARKLAARVREKLLGDGYGPTLSGWVEKLAPRVDPSGLRRLEQLVELGFRWEDRATLRPGDFVRFVESETVEDPLSTPVRVMTVHQAKGLEFDVVVLPELDDSIRTGRVETALPERDPDTGLVQRVFPAVEKRLRPLFPEMERALTQVRRASIRDELSWLYVGVTRARHALHLLVAADDGSSGAKSFARLVRAAIERHGEAAPEGEVLFESGDVRWYEEVDGMEEGAERPSPADVDLRVDPDAPRSRVLAQRSPSDLESGGEVDPKRLLRLEEGEGRRHGEVAHRWLRQVRWIEHGLPGEEAMGSAARSAAPGMTADEVEGLVDRFRGWMEAPGVRRALARDATSARLRELAAKGRRGEGPSADALGLEVETERRFAHRTGDEVVSGVVDRLVLAREPGGRVVAAEVVDFKTDRLDPGDGDALEERTVAYRPQVEAYREAVAEMHGLDAEAVGARLVFLDADTVREL
jgi:ATP-dependent exoDNAse (exonuclease V) beta subunit